MGVEERENFGNVDNGVNDMHDEEESFDFADLGSDNDNDNDNVHVDESAECDEKYETEPFQWRLLTKSTQDALGRLENIGSLSTAELLDSIARDVRRNSSKPESLSSSMLFEVCAGTLIRVWTPARSKGLIDV